MLYLFGGSHLEVAPGSTAAFWAAVPHQLVASSSTRAHWVYVPFSTFLGWGLPEDVVSRILSGTPLVPPPSTRLASDEAGFEHWAADLATDDPERHRIAMLEGQARIRRLALREHQRDAGHFTGGDPGRAPRPRHGAAHRRALPRTGHRVRSRRRRPAASELRQDAVPQSRPHDHRRVPGAVSACRGTPAVGDHRPAHERGRRGRRLRVGRPLLRRFSPPHAARRQERSDASTAGPPTRRREAHPGRRTPCLSSQTHECGGRSPARGFTRGRNDPFRLNRRWFIQRVQAETALAASDRALVTGLSRSALPAVVDGGEGLEASVAPRVALRGRTTSLSGGGTDRWCRPHVDTTGPRHWARRPNRRAVAGLTRSTTHRPRRWLLTPSLLRSSCRG